LAFRFFEKKLGKKLPLRCAHEIVTIEILWMGGSQF
jgi:hypothetical protein